MQKRKIADFVKKTDTKYAIHSTLITTYGVAESAYSGELQSIVTSDDLFTKYNKMPLICSIGYK